MEKDTETTLLEAAAATLTEAQIEPSTQTLYSMKDGAVIYVDRVNGNEVAIFRASSWSAGAISIEKFKSKVSGKIGKADLRK
jgi:hypothetical protein